MIGRILRGLAKLVVRGPDAPIVLGDLEESMGRDLAGGMPPWRAHARYLRNALASAARLASERPRRRRGLLPSLGASLLDVKLGVRMLFKHPGLTAVAVFALALGIPASLTPLYVLDRFDVALPFDEGERIVGMRYRRIEGMIHRRASAFEYRLWRERLSGLEAVGAARRTRYNVVAEGRVLPVAGAEMTASAFRITRVPPLLGRPLIDADEEPGAADVVVIGHELWRSLFARDPDVVGRTMLVAGEPHTVVGVMPEGFLFPRRDYLWIPLRTGAPAEPTRDELQIFGRLADGVTEQQVLAQMQSIHAGLVERFPDVLGNVRPQIASYVMLVTGNPTTGDMRRIVAPIQLLALVLLAVACGNVGTLILARTATRTSELAVRTALGASRARIVGQLFAESFVLALLATGVGLAVAWPVAGRFAAMVERTEEMAGSGLGFWYDFSPDHRTVLQALAVSVFCAVIAGVVPALKATAGGIQGSLQRAAAGRSGVRFGGVVSALIVVEVALGVACLYAGGIALLMAPRAGVQMEIPADRFLAAEVRVPRLESLDGEESEEAHRARESRVHRELVERLGSEPGVHGVAMGGTLPGEDHPVARIEVEGGDLGDDGRGHRVLVGWVGVGFFEAVGAPVLEGRGFREDDLEAHAREGDAPVVVNTSFVERVFRGQHPIGRRIRYVARAEGEAGRWYEVVGVARRLGMSNFDGLGDDAGFYYPIAPGEAESVLLRVDGDPAAWAPRLREVAAAIDPAVLVEEPLPLSRIVEESRVLLAWVLFALAIVAGISIVLSVAGLYALMSFTVAQRTREIGVRSALGADTGRMVAVIARRAVLQLTAGIALGAAGSLAFVLVLVPELFTWVEGEGAALGWASSLVLAIGLLACVVPTRRGLRIQPMEALRAEG